MKVKHPPFYVLHTQTQVKHYLCNYSITDGTSHVVKVNIYPIRAALLELRRDVLLAVVHGCRKTQVFH